MFVLIVSYETILFNVNININRMPYFVTILCQRGQTMVVWSERRSLFWRIFNYGFICKSC